MAAARKRRKRGEGSIARLANGSWQVAITDDFGRRNTRRVRGSRADAVAALAELRATSRPSDGPLTLLGAIETYIARAELAGTTRASHLSALRQVGIPTVPHPQGAPIWTGWATPLKSLTPSRLTALYAQVDEMSTFRAVRRDGIETRERVPVGESTKRRVRAIVGASLSMAVRLGSIDANPDRAASTPWGAARARATGTRKPGDTRGGLVVAAPEEVKAALKALGGDWAGVMVRVLATCGLRLSEACGLSWADVDLGHGRLRVQRAAVVAGGGVRSHGTTKTEGSVRPIALDPTTVAMLTVYRETCASEWVFPSGDGTRPMRRDNASAWIQRRLRSAGIEIVLRDLRHFAATQMLAGGIDPKTVADRLGHDDVRTTLRFYAAWIPARDEAAAEVLGNLLDG